jgi:tRNA dimethylallyltransferase
MNEASAPDTAPFAPGETSDAIGAVQPLTIALMGPTASGKTDLALELAEALDLAVLSVDSRQLYRGMDVGTAKPTAAQRRRVRHELLDLRDPDQPINLQEFTELAQAAIAAEHRRRGVALLVGGSGLYLESLLRGLAPPAVPPQPALRAQLAALGQPLCHGLLRQADPEAATRIMPADAVRTQRALEVLYATGRPLSSQRRLQPPPWRVLEIGLQPTNLRERIQRRTVCMYEEGLVEETAALLERFGADCPLLRTMGYDEARRLLAGELDRSAAIALTERRTRQYAKRQRTWFRRRHNPVWLGQSRLETGQDSGQDIAPDQAAATRAAGDLLRETLELTHRVLG